MVTRMSTEENMEDVTLTLRCEVLRSKTDPFTKEQTPDKCIVYTDKDGTTVAGMELYLEKNLEDNKDVYPYIIEFIELRPEFYTGKPWNIEEAVMRRLILEKITKGKAIRIDTKEEHAKLVIPL